MRATYDSSPAGYPGAWALGRFFGSPVLYSVHPVSSSAGPTLQGRWQPAKSVERQDRNCPRSCGMGLSPYPRRILRAASALGASDPLSWKLDVLRVKHSRDLTQTTGLGTEKAAGEGSHRRGTHTQASRVPVGRVFRASRGIPTGVEVVLLLCVYSYRGSHGTSREHSGARG